jgi:Flp pilus assembly pilin Flp
MNCPRTSLLHRLGRDDNGLTTVEYVIVLAMIAVLAVGLWRSFGNSIKSYLTNSAATIDGAMPVEVRSR